MMLWMDQILFYSIIVVKDYAILLWQPPKMVLYGWLLIHLGMVGVG
jgi:hypothetical protein